MRIKLPVYTMASSPVKGARDFSRELYKTNEYTRVSRMAIVKFLKIHAIDANTADFRSVFDKEWF